MRNISTKIALIKPELSVLDSERPPLLDLRPFILQLYRITLTACKRRNSTTVVIL
jgi:hypothetical protein